MRLIKGTIPALICLLSLFVLLSAAQNVSAYEALRVAVPVNCLSVYGNGTHTYELKIETESSPEPVVDTLTVTEDSTGAFEIDLTEPGTYHYSVYEAAGGDTAVKYDSTRYDIVIFAEDSGSGGLRSSMTACISGSDSKAESISFRDTVLSGTVTTAPPVTTAVRTTAAVTVTAAASAKEHKTDIIDSILTGDSFPAHAIRLAMLISAMAAIFTFLFRHKQSEEEEKNG